MWIYCLRIKCTLCHGLASQACEQMARGSNHTRENIILSFKIVNVLFIIIIIIII
jgi:hypothetical protein